MECSKCGNKAFKPLETDSRVCMICGTYVYCEAEVVMPQKFTRLQAAKQGNARGGKPSITRNKETNVTYMQKMFDKIQKMLLLGKGWNYVESKLPKDREQLLTRKALSKYYSMELKRRGILEAS